MLSVQGSSSRVNKRVVTTREVKRNSSGAADLVHDLTRETKPGLVPCPFLAALFDEGLIKPDEDGTWSKDDCYKAIDTIVKPTDSPTLPLLKATIPTVFFGPSLPLVSDTTEMRIPFNEWKESNLHKYHTGIRLPKVIGGGDPLNWKGPCGTTLNGPDCGEPGVHPETFDKLVELSDRLSKKGDDEKWTAEDAVSLCDTAKKTLYAPDDSDNDDAYYKPGGLLFGKADVCATLYGTAVEVFDKQPCNGLKKQDWKNFLVDATFPECYDLKSYF